MEESQLLHGDTPLFQDLELNSSSFEYELNDLSMFLTTCF